MKQFLNCWRAAPPTSWYARHVLLQCLTWQLPNFIFVVITTIITITTIIITTTPNFLVCTPCSTAVLVGSTSKCHQHCRRPGLIFFRQCCSVLRDFHWTHCGFLTVFNPILRISCGFYPNFWKFLFSSAKPLSSFASHILFPARSLKQIKRERMKRFFCHLVDWIFR